MITIRLKRIGRKKRPFFHIVVAQTLSSVNSKYIDKLGYFDPISKEKILKINMDKIKTWVKNGAKISKRVQSLIKLN